MSTIRVSNKLIEKVQNLKRRLNVSSAEDVIWELLRVYDAQAEAVASDSAHDEPRRERRDDPEKKTPGQLLSYVALSSSPVAIKHFTGLKEDPAKWLWKTLGDAVTIFRCVCTSVSARTVLVPDACVCGIIVTNWFENFRLTSHCNQSLEEGESLTLGTVSLTPMIEYSFS